MSAKRRVFWMTLAMWVVCLAGCGSGGGGMGGQGFHITINQYGSDEATTQPAFAEGAAGNTSGKTSGSNASNICITNADGGTLAGNPSVAVPETTATEATPPNEPETPPNP